MRRAIHFLLMLLGFPMWCVAYIAMVIVTYMAVLGDKVLPNSNTGNCWSYVLPLWYDKGGYIVLRKSHGASFLKVFPVIHAMHSRTMRDVTHIKPKDHRTSSWFPWFTVYFEYEISTKEVEH